MNYYEHHIGDYAKDAGHLSMLEHGAYRLLIDAYYTREKNLPADERECFKLARAQSKLEREAVSYVLKEFFQLTEDGYRQKRCDLEIARFLDKQAKARNSANERWKHRQSQSEGNANASETHQDNSMRTHSEGNATRARPQSPVTSNQAPDSSHQLEKQEAKAPPSGGASPPPAAAKRARPKPPPQNGTDLNGHGELLPPAPASGTPGSQVWAGYAEAYTARYGAAPVRNAKTNALCAQVAQRLPHAEAAAVARFYVEHPLAFYAQRGHALDLLVRDAEKLRTEWATRQPITAIRAQQDERLSHHVQIAAELKEEFRHAAK